MCKFTKIFLLATVSLTAAAQSAIYKAPEPSPITIVNEADVIWADLVAQLKTAEAGINPRIAAERTAGFSNERQKTAENSSLSKNIPTVNTTPSTLVAVDYNQAVFIAREFMQKFPDDSRWKEVKKIELTSLLKQQRASGKKLVASDNAKIDNFIRDQAMPARDRYDISALAKKTRADLSSFKNTKDVRTMHARHARELIHEFPEDPRGYGYLLAVAKSLSSGEARNTAANLLQSNAPKKIKEGAKRLIAQKDMEGKKLRIDGLPLDAYVGQPVIIYTWTKQRPDIFQFVKRRCNLSGVNLIGINIDSDEETARQLAHEIQLPGKQYYFGGGLDGPLASQLHIQTVMSVYIVDGDGRLVDTRGHENTGEKLKLLLDGAHNSGQIINTREGGFQ